MIENLKRLREPVAWIVIAVTAMSIVLAIVRFGFELSTSVPLTSAAETVALTAMNLTLVVLCLAVTWVSIFVPPQVPRAGVIAWWAAMLVSFGTVLTLVGAIAGLVGADDAVAVIFGFLGVILDIVLKGVATVVLWLMYHGVHVGRFTVHDTSPSDADDEQQKPRPPTTWAPGQATGAAWTTAADAASGAPAAGLGTTGPRAGWNVGNTPHEGGGAGAGGGVTPRGTSSESDPYRLDESE